jgi:F0F1-type ATP synthase epsilon subunit
MEESAANITLVIVVRDLKETLFQGGAEAISGINETGPFDVLGAHANFVCPLKEKVVVRTLEKTVKEFSLEKGVMRVKDNKVEVFIGI